MKKPNSIADVLGAYYGALMVSDHRYGCGWTAALMADATHGDLFSDLTDASGSLPFILQPMLTHSYVPVFVARGDTLLDAIAALETKIEGMSQVDIENAHELLREIYNEAQNDLNFSTLDAEIKATPWFQKLVAEDAIPGFWVDDAERLSHLSPADLDKCTVLIDGVPVSGATAIILRSDCPCPPGYIALADYAGQVYYIDSEHIAQVRAALKPTKAGTDVSLVSFCFEPTPPSQVIGGLGSYGSVKVIGSK